VRILGLTAKTRIYQASTSELYGLVQEIPQKESAPFDLLAAQGLSMSKLSARVHPFRIEGT